MCLCVCVLVCGCRAHGMLSVTYPEKSGLPFTGGLALRLQQRGDAVGKIGRSEPTAISDLQRERFKQYVVKSGLDGRFY